MRSAKRGINLDKETSRAAKPDLGSKPSQATPVLSPFGIQATRELGSYGGIQVAGDATAQLEELLPSGVSIGINPAEQSATAEVELGSKNGFGISFGGEVKRTPTGVSVENVSFGVNVLGFGVNAEGKGNESSKLGVTAFGVTVEVASDKDGKTSVRLGLSLPGISTGITFAPDGGIAIPDQELTPKKPDASPALYPPPGPPRSTTSFAIGACVYYNRHSYGKAFFDYRLEQDFDYPTAAPSSDNSFSGLMKVAATQRWTDNNVQQPNIVYYSGSNTNTNVTRVYGAPDILEGEPWVNQKTITYLVGFYSPDRYSINYPIFTEYYYVKISGMWLWRSTWTNEISECKCPDAKPPLVSIQLPNYPQKYNPMNCCDKVEEIYKYLGIAKMKKKFKVSKQFLVPGGKGNEECEDYYALNEALFRMLANGLILNPISTPLGSEWKSVNATAWAGQVYEMVAEAMSNGDTTQKFEISAIMQLVQTMSAVAELSRKVDFISEVLGVTPDLGTEDLPVCFTIHESHKGFEKKKPKEIDVAGAKTDDEVEKVLGKMLQPSKIPIVKWEFKPDSVSIAAALNRL